MHTEPKLKLNYIEVIKWCIYQTTIWKENILWRGMSTCVHVGAFTYLLVFSQLSVNRDWNCVILNLFTIQQLLKEFTFLLLLLHQSFRHPR